MFITKSKLRKYIEMVKQENRCEKNGANYNSPISEKQQILNVYCQGFEDGTDNMYYAICHKLKIKRNKGE